jgi:arylsulfatase
MSKEFKRVIKLDVRDSKLWQLYHTDVDRAESKALTKQHPDKLQALIKA